MVQSFEASKLSDKSMLLRPKLFETRMRFHRARYTGKPPGTSGEAAKRAGATLILVPTANYEDAKPFEDKETLVVAVNSFDNALQVISEYSSR